MEVTCKVTLFENIGQSNQKVRFKAGSKYRYSALESSFQRHFVYPNTGRESIFNEEDFYKYFTTSKSKLS